MSTPPPAPERPRFSLEDAAGLVVALVFGVASFVYPFGRDQGLYYYVGREWALRGAIPYRDVFDHKTPGIYVLHALSVKVFGEVMWGIRIIDLLGVLAMAFVVAWLAATPGKPIARSTVGRATLFVTLFYYGVLNFWDTAQSELHYTMLGCLALAAAQHHAPERRALPFVSGLALGAALVMKPPVMWVGLAVVIVLGLRLREQKADAKAIARTATTFAVGGAVPLAVTLAYFAKHGALAAMKDIVVGANGYYVSHEHAKNPVADGVDAIQWYLAHTAPLGALVVAAAAVAYAIARRVGDSETRASYGRALGVSVACFVCIAMQMKFYLLHFTPMIAPLALLGVLASEGASRGLGGLGFSARAARLAPWLVVLAGYFTSPTGRRWVEQQLAVSRYLSGKDDRQWYLHRYSFADIHFDYADSEWVGLWLKEHTKEDEPVLVRGFQPEVYASAQRRYPGRFYWTLFLTHPARAYRREEYLAEDEKALAEAKPRYLVARRDYPDLDAANPAYYEARGYRPIVERGYFVIMERVGR